MPTRQGAHATRKQSRAQHARPCPRRIPATRTLPSAPAAAAAAALSNALACLLPPQVGKQVFEGAPRQMRVELWKSSLQRRGVGVAAAKSYEDLLQGEVRGGDLPEHASSARARAACQAAVWPGGAAPQRGAAGSAASGCS